jgi:acetyl-CoA carboxylase biotin carboxylase subunit
VVPGAHETLTGPAHARVFAQQFGYPLLLKAVAGGGGKGMRRVDSDAELDSAFRDASSEAERSFKNPDLYVEKLIERPRHIEIQLMGDRFGHMVHFGERECSIQRRHQKVMEECPSPLVAARPGMREAMGEAAIRVARSAGYYNAGTVEFLVDARGDFYFLEMNTRLQVEHPITELVTGHDLVRLQMEVAAGEKLSLRQEDISWRGSAIECRIYAEDPYNNFFPSPGKITRLTRPLGPGVRLDGCVYDGWTVPIDYDPLLAKLAVWSGTRENAIARMLRALREYDVAGIHTNITFFRQILEDEEFRAGRLHTRFVDEFLERRKLFAPPPDLESIAALVAAFHSTSNAVRPESAPAPRSRWLEMGRHEALR